MVQIVVIGKRWVARLARAGGGCFDRAMTKSEKTLPRTGPAAAQAQAERAAREAAALRENLRRRKAQARAREDGENTVADVPDAPETR
jgi:hypothetical protein